MTHTGMNVIAPSVGEDGARVLRRLTVLSGFIIRTTAEVSNQKLSKGGPGPAAKVLLGRGS